LLPKTNVTDDVDLEPDHITKNWSQYVQSPAQLAFTRLTRFPPGSSTRLIDVLDIESGETILEIGSGLGIMASRLKKADPSLSIAGCELNRTYLEAELPGSLVPRKEVPEFRGDGQTLPIDDDSVDRVYSHALATLIHGEPWERLHRECRRVLKNGGRVIHMDNIHNDGWTPEALADAPEEQNRREEFNRIHRQVHQELETGYGHTARNLPERLDQVGGEDVSVDCYSWAFDLNDPETWEPQQRRELLDLWEKADRDRIVQFRSLLERIDQCPEHWSTLFDQSLEDIEDQSQRRKRAIDHDKDIGWRSCTTLAVSAVL
jgi:SAM-dependent methyltransferase